MKRRHRRANETREVWNLKYYHSSNSGGTRGYYSARNTDRHLFVKYFFVCPKSINLFKFNNFNSIFSIPKWLAFVNRLIIYQLMNWYFQFTNWRISMIIITIMLHIYYEFDNNSINLLLITYLVQKTLRNNDGRASIKIIFITSKIYS